jgi:hypothetical protein
VPTFQTAMAAEAEFEAESRKWTLFELSPLNWRVGNKLFWEAQRCLPDDL